MKETRTIETTGRVIDARHIETTIPIPVGQRVRLLIFLPSAADDEMAESEWMEAATKNPIFDFLANPAEDIYTMDDGEPVELEK